MRITKTHLIIWERKKTAEFHSVVNNHASAKVWMSEPDCTDCIQLIDANFINKVEGLDGEFLHNMV